MHRKKYQSNLVLFAGVVSLAVVLTFVGLSSSLKGQIVSENGYSMKGQNSTQLADLSIVRSASDSVAWDGTYAVHYTVTNNGGLARQALSVEPYFSGGYDNIKRMFITSPISYSGMKTADGIPPNRVGCGTFGGNVRCIFTRGINPGETLEYTIFYAVNKSPVQCDRVLTMAPVTIAPGMNLHPFALQSSLRTDANPADNTTASQSVRIDCASLTGDLQTEVSGPESIAKNAVGEYIITLRNVGPILSSTVPVQITTPSNGFEIVSIKGVERGGMCSKTKILNQQVCNNPSVQLAPGQSVSYTLKLKTKNQECGSGEIKVEIVKSLKTPNPKFTEIYDTNDGNNISILQTQCDGSMVDSPTAPPVSSPVPVTPSVPTPPQTPNPWSNKGFF